VKQVAEAAGISIRTLHHYDEIGLLKPAEIGENGYRYYDKPQMLRLQQILFYREIGFSLAAIGPILDDPGFDPVDALRGHRSALEGEIGRYRDLIRTIDRTIESLERKTEMEDNELYRGISPEKRARWDREIEERFGQCNSEALEQSRSRLSAMTAAEAASFKAEIDALHKEMAELADNGAESGSGEVQAVIARHYGWVCKSWTPDAKSYEGLGRFYVESAEFRAMFDEIRPGLAEYFAEAMAAYARRFL
jgi:DNA-binding transcriptional MerR regulator